MLAKMKLYTKKSILCILLSFYATFIFELTQISNVYAFPTRTLSADPRKNREVEYLRSVLEDGNHDNTKYDDIFDPCFVSQAGPLDALKILIDHGYDIHARYYNNSMTILMCNAEYGDPEITKYIIAHGVDVNAKNNTNQTALMFAAASGNYLSLNVLIESGAKLDEQDDDGGTALMESIVEIDPYRKNFFVEGEIDELADVKTAKLLIDRGANLFLKDNKGKTALDYARIHHKARIVAMLESAMAKINGNGNNSNIVIPNDIEINTNLTTYAILKSDFDYDYLNKDNCPQNFREWNYIIHSVDPSYSFGHSLICSVDYGDIMITNLLIKKNSNVNAITAYLNDTVLMNAARAVNFAAIELLLKHGADATINAQDIRGRTALMEIAFNQSERKMAILSNIFDFRHLYAAEASAALLINAGADINIRDKKGYSALDYARQHKKHGLVKLLIKNGAK